MKQNCKTFIVFGETGSGKSTLLNSLVNYLLHVDKYDPFRYVIIVDNPKTQMHSITNKISDYYVQDTVTQIVYRFIDTPGFGDTNGLLAD